MNIWLVPLTRTVLRTLHGINVQTRNVCKVVRYFFHPSKVHLCSFFVFTREFLYFYYSLSLETYAINIYLWIFMNVTPNSKKRRKNLKRLIDVSSKIDTFSVNCISLFTRVRCSTYARESSKATLWSQYIYKRENRFGILCRNTYLNVTIESSTINSLVSTNRKFKSFDPTKRVFENVPFLQTSVITQGRRIKLLIYVDRLIF